MLSDQDITGIAIDAALRIHRRVGPGAFERAYAEFLTAALRSSDLTVAREVTFPIAFEGVEIPLGYRVDLLVNDRVIIEVKCTNVAHPVHKQQLLTYLRLSKRRTGLLLNFGLGRMSDGIHRMVNGWE